MLGLLLNHVLGVHPHFILLGAQKAGTTSFFAALARHPGIQHPRKKEFHFFNRKYLRTLLWYRKSFPTSRQLGRGRLTGEGSPSYLCHPHVPRRLHKALPGVKLIALLRDPVDRAVSQYFHERAKGRESLPMAEAFAAEDARLEPELRRMLRQPWYDSPVYRYFSYQRRGLYAEQLTRFLQYFPREQLHVVRSEDFFDRPREILARAHEFLGLPADAIATEGPWLNRGGYETEEVPEEIREQLARYYHPHNLALYRLLGVQWDWREPAGAGQA